MPGPPAPPERPPNIASEQSLNIAKALHREFFDLPELRLQTISPTREQLVVDFVEPSLSLLKFREQRWRLTTIGDHTRKIANFGLQFFALLSRCPEVRAHAFHFLFEELTGHEAGTDWPLRQPR